MLFYAALFELIIWVVKKCLGVYFSSSERNDVRVFWYVCVNTLFIREGTEAPTELARQLGTVRSDKLVLIAWDDILIFIHVF
jgi:hypothetical protein